MLAMKEILGPQRAEGHSGEVKHTGKLIAKYVRCETFAGDQAKWEDWSFAFKRSIRSMSRDAYDAMTEWEKGTEDLDEETELSKELEQRSAELYDILCQFCSGEALMVVRSVEDMEGIKAWQRLHKKYNPKTMARGVRMLTEVIGPPKITELTNFETSVTMWEEKVKRLTAQFNENVSNNMKIAIFTNMMPASLQDFVYIHTEKDCKYEEVREKVAALVSNKVAANARPTPMDIGDVGENGEEWWHACDEQYDDEQEVDIVAGYYQCRNCEGYGHFARECPSKGKGKGKGPKGIEKGKGKGKGKAKGKGVKGERWSLKGKGSGKDQMYGYRPQPFNGKGKGYQGECWNCGQVGHKANECTAMDTNCVEGTAEETIEIEGMWEVSNVQAGVGHVKVENRFAALVEEDEMEEQRCDTLLEMQVAKTPIRKTYLQAATGRTQAQTIGDAMPKITEGVAMRVEAPRPRSCSRMPSVYEEVREISEINIEEVAAEKAFTRPSSMTFNVAGVCKPLASAAKVVEAGNRIVMDPSGSYIENVKTGERMQLRKKKGVFVFEVKYQDGDSGEITLDSGAGVSVWPKGHKQSLLRVGPRQEGLKMVAANGTAIENVGQTKVVFRGVAPETSSFSGQPW